MHVGDPEEQCRNCGAEYYGSHLAALCCTELVGGDGR